MLKNNNYLWLLKLLGALLVLAGLLFSFMPDIIFGAPQDVLDTYQGIERRVRWGLLIGVGLLLLMYEQKNSWPLTLATAALWITTGFLIARFIGLFVEGMDNQKQWFWVAFEVLIIVAAGFYIFRVKNLKKQSATE